MYNFDTSSKATDKKEAEQINRVESIFMDRVRAV